MKYNYWVRGRRVNAVETLQNAHKFEVIGGRPMTMYRLAQITGLSQPTIKNVLVGKHTPRLSTKRKIMNALNPYAKAY